MVEAAIKGDSEHATNTLPSTGLMAASTRTLAQEIGVFDNPWDEKRVSISPIPRNSASPRLSPKSPGRQSVYYCSCSELVG